MSMSMFAPAQKKKSRLRLAITGPAGSGKTYTALSVASAIAAKTGGRVAVLDTERGSASLYSDQFPFDVCELESFSPERYIEVIAGAERAGYDVLVIDSLSHAWAGKDGALEMVDRAASQSRSGNSFEAWRKVTPLQTRMIDAVLRSKCHIVTTMRTKTEWVLEENEKGKKVPKKIGMAPVQRADLDYEFTLVGEMDLDHTLTVTKTRCGSLDGAVIHKPGRSLGETLMEWLESGADETPRPPAEFDALSVAIDCATTEAELRALVPRIKTLPIDQQRAIKPSFTGREMTIKAEVAAAKRDASEATNEPAAPAQE